MSLADTTGATCAFQNLPEAAWWMQTTIESTRILCVREVWRGGLSSAYARLHRGFVVETDITDTDGRPVAKVLQTQAVLRCSTGGR